MRSLHGSEVKRITKFIGFDADESHRAKDYDDSKFKVEYPLIEWGWGRDECIDEIRKENLPLPSKSSCFLPKHEATRDYGIKRALPSLSRTRIKNRI